MKTRSFLWILSVLPLMPGCRHVQPIHQLIGTPNWQPDTDHATQLRDEETNGNGIEVGAPKVYDDASLRMMLDATRAKLAGMSGLNQDALISRLGSISGATISQSQVGLQVTGPSLPGVTSTNTGPTNSVTTNGGLPQGNTSTPATVTVATDPTQTVVTTSTGTTPPGAPTVPGGIAFTPPGSLSPSALDVLNEQMQLSYEMANLQLLLEGALSDRFVTNQRFIKPRTTLGFPISLRAPEQFRNAVAVVEVEVETARQNLSDPNVPEPPAITALLPREKTYNVAAMTDRMTSIGGGAVIGMVGVSGSFVRGRKTFYLVQDQDTVAMQRPPNPTKKNVTSFLWEFHPVLGQEYVRGGMKQVFVQLALPTLDTVDCFGSIRIRTYWRHFDQKRGITGPVIPESVLASTRIFPVPRFDLVPSVEAIDYQDLGDGTVMVTASGSYLAGTYVQLGPTRYDAGKNLILEDTGVKFIAPIAALARWTGHIVARNGAQSDLLNPDAQEPLSSIAQTACITPGLQRIPAAPRQCSERLRIVSATPEPLNETDSTLRVEIETTMGEAEAKKLLLAIGGRVFGLKDAVVKRESGRAGPIITAIVPTALLILNPEVRVFQPFWSDRDGRGLHCRDASYSITGFGQDSTIERLILVSVDKDGNAVYLLYGNGLDKAKLLVPDTDASLEQVDNITGGRIRLLKIKKSALLITKKIVLQKADKQRPLVLDLPDAKATPPKASVDSPVIQNTAELDLSVEQANDVTAVKLDDKVLKYKPVDKSTIRLLNLKVDGVTNEQKTREITIEYRNGAKVTVKLEVVAARIGVK
jgi:hypothetical protein